MKVPCGKEKREKNKNELVTFAVPFALDELNKKRHDKNINAGSREELINQAFKLHGQGNIQAAIKSYQYFIAQGYNDPRVYSNYGIILKDLGKLKEAEVSIRKAIEIKPDFLQANINLATTLRQLGKHEEAKLSLLEAIRLKPDFAELHLNLGNILTDLGKSAEAEVSIRKAIKLKPNLVNAHITLGVILNDLGKYKDAEISYNKAISLKPDSNSALINRWQLFFDNGNYEAALKDIDRLDTQVSRACALETLFALGRIDEIHKRIKKTSNTDYGNIRMAAFCSFLAQKNKKDTGHQFCQNPLSFLYYSNLKYHRKDYKEFINQIISELNNVEKLWQPYNFTTHNGFHTPDYINLFSNSSKRIAQLKSIILNELNTYHKKFEKQNCSYIKRWPSNKTLQAWHVVLKKQGYQEAHIHPSGWLSGVIYLKVVPPLSENEGAIEFSLNSKNYFNVNAPKLTYQPQLGDIIFFPSSLHHRTIPFSTDTERMVIAFDLLPN